jgi:hypothetical protein
LRSRTNPRLILRTAAPSAALQRVVPAHARRGKPAGERAQLKPYGFACGSPKSLYYSVLEQRSILPSLYSLRRRICAAQTDGMSIDGFECFAADETGATAIEYG